MRKRVFADTLYWIAITHRKDQWHQDAVNASPDAPSLGHATLFTTEEVLDDSSERIFSLTFSGKKVDAVGIR